MIREKVATERAAWLLLKNEFNKRKRHNSRYSIRAFAKFLGMDHSFLSKILRRKRMISELVLKKMGKYMALSEIEMEELNRALVRKKRKIKYLGKIK